MSTEATIPAELAALVGTTAHVATGTRYASYNVTAVVPHETEPGWWHLRAGRLQSPAIRPDSVHATEADARAAIRARRAAAKARRDAAGPRMMAATDGNMLAMLMGATRARSR